MVIALILSVDRLAGVTVQPDERRITPNVHAGFCLLIVWQVSQYNQTNAGLPTWFMH